MTDAYPRGIEIVTGAVIENETGQILLARSPKWQEKWSLPGGHIDPGENILNACVREGEEETSLQLQGVKIFHFGELIGSTDFHRPAHFIYFNVHCRVIGGVQKLDERELTASRWVSPRDALLLDLADSFKDTIESYIDYKRI